MILQGEAMLIYERFLKPDAYMYVSTIPEDIVKNIENALKEESKCCNPHYYFLISNFRSFSI
jgi:hypothetical protein